MSSNLLKRFNREQSRLLLATLPTCGRGDYDSVPEVDQQALLRRMELQRLTRKGGR